MSARGIMPLLMEEAELAGVRPRARAYSVAAQVDAASDPVALVVKLPAGDGPYIWCGGDWSEALFSGVAFVGPDLGIEVGSVPYTNGNAPAGALFYLSNTFGGAVVGPPPEWPAPIVCQQASTIIVTRPPFAGFTGPVTMLLNGFHVDDQQWALRLKSRGELYAVTLTLPVPAPGNIEAGTRQFPFSMRTSYIVDRMAGASSIYRSTSLKQQPIVLRDPSDVAAGTIVSSNSDPFYTQWNRGPSRLIQRDISPADQFGFDTFSGSATQTAIKSTVVGVRRAIL